MVVDAFHEKWSKQERGRHSMIAYCSQLLTLPPCRRLYLRSVDARLDYMIWFPTPRPTPAVTPPGGYYMVTC